VSANRASRPAPNLQSSSRARLARSHRALGTRTPTAYLELDEDSTLADSEWTYLDEQFLIDKHSDWTNSRGLVTY
jgi:hypothetical protein